MRCASASAMASTSALVPVARRGDARCGSHTRETRKLGARRGFGRGTKRVDAADTSMFVAHGSAHRRVVVRAGSLSDEETTSVPEPNNASKTNRPFRFCIDRGGTFTDVYAEVPGPTPDSPHTHRTLKLLSEDPGNYESAPREGIRRILEEVLGTPIPRSSPVPTAQIEWIRMGTTVATNALLERQGAKTALVVTKGFSDLLKIGNQSRPNIFDLKIAKPSELYCETVEVDERIRVVSKDVLGDDLSDELMKDPRATDNTTTGEKIVVEKELDVEALRPKLRALLDSGVKSLAVVLLHSYVYPEHETLIGNLATELGFEQVSLSSQLVPMVRAVPRGHTASVDAYLTPVTTEYLKLFLSGFDDGLQDVTVSFMQSDGGLTPASRFSGYKAILSGPAGGVVGYAVTTSEDENNDNDECDSKKSKPPPTIGFDMGGTSTDVSRYHGVFEQVTETQTAGVTIQAPQLDITTVAAGGGSRLAFKSGTFRVGPESVGSEPGPVCYRKGGEYLSVTDANVLLGRVLPEYFPAIFGPSEDEPLDYETTKSAFEKERDAINEQLAAIASSNGDPSPKPLTTEDIASGYLRVANEAMCRPIRQITESKGYESSQHVLAAFGGAGPQHACSVARALGIKKVFVHRFCGILSAYGMGLANVVSENQLPFSGVLSDGDTNIMNEETLKRALAVAQTLKQNVVCDLKTQGFDNSDVQAEVFLNLRYDGTDTAMMILGDSEDSYIEKFKAQFEREYGFDLVNRDLIVDDVRVRGTGISELLRRVPIYEEEGEDEKENGDSSSLPSPDTVKPVYFEGFQWCDTPIYLIDTLKSGNVVPGPAVIMNGTATCVIEPSCVATLTQFGDLRVDVDMQGISGMRGSDMGIQSKKVTDEIKLTQPNSDPVQLSIFSNRFMGIAEQMGRTLQRTAVSTNIKERLDFSCALFDPSGGLVANAPHVPVHLGAMSSTVRWQIEYYSENGPGASEGLNEGDVIVTNHPCAGGSHLPDITVVTPVFRDHKIVFFVASRGHHADVGGSTPGSMPPFSRNISEEGAAIKTFKLVNKGVYDGTGIKHQLSESRKLNDNLSDLNAQSAANARGIFLINELIDEYGLQVVQSYMVFVQENAELAVRDMLKETAKRLLRETGEDTSGAITLQSSDRMDDGSEIKLMLKLNATTGSADFDFTGTSCEVYGNWNAPKAVTSAAVIYVIRCLVNQEIPLNEGCLRPVSITIPDGTFLSPSEDAAVVGGNVLTSQRVTDVCLAAFNACANAQGCMNNLTFGDATFGYYETIGGGAGAGPTWDGASGTQCHMTNTRITDPEILERRYPVVLREFSIRTGSGGDGLFKGGDGVNRTIEFLKPITVSVLTERRVFAPRGLNRGGDGKIGENHLFVRNGDDDDVGDGNSTSSAREINLGGKNSVTVQPGDVLRILSPGGGGYGEKE